MPETRFRDEPGPRALQDRLASVATQSPEANFSRKHRVDVPDAIPNAMQYDARGKSVRHGPRTKVFGS
jgi:hypothetical protein